MGLTQDSIGLTQDSIGLTQDSMGLTEDQGSITALKKASTFSTGVSGWMLCAGATI